MLSNDLLSDTNKLELKKEFLFKSSRSGGSGGQNVNKVSTKVEIVFNIDASTVFNEEQKELLKVKLSNKIDREGNLHMQSQKSRSQLANKEDAMDKLFHLLENAIKKKVERKATKVPSSVIAKRLDQKKEISHKKATRKKIGLKDW